MNTFSEIWNSIQWDWFWTFSFAIVFGGTITGFFGQWAKNIHAAPVDDFFRYKSGQLEIALDAMAKANNNLADILDVQRDLLQVAEATENQLQIIEGLLPPVGDPYRQ